MEDAKLFMRYRKHMLSLKGKKNAGEPVEYNDNVSRSIVSLARKISGVENSRQAMIRAFQTSKLLLAKRYLQSGVNAKELEALADLLQNDRSAKRVSTEIVAKNTISRALKGSKYLETVRRKVSAKRLLADAKKLFMYLSYLQHAHPHYKETQELYNKYGTTYAKAVNLTKKLTNEENLNRGYSTAKLIIGNYSNTKNFEEQVKKIQRAYRKSTHIPTNQEVLKLANKTGNFALKPFENWNKVNKLEYKRGDMGPLLNRIRARRNKLVAPVVTTLQKHFRGYKSRTIEPRKQFLTDLAHDRRFDYYVVTLTKLEYKVDSVLRSIAMGGSAPVNAITSIIGVCHYKPGPHKKVQNVKNVRKSIPLLKKQTPREYLQGLRKQFSYVAGVYAKMSPGEKKEYRDRLFEELSGRPCLENLLESLAKVLTKPEFVWKGKYTDPLLPHNERYLGNLMNKAVQSWALSKNRPTGWNNMNLNARKKLFWNKVKGLPLYMVHNGDIVNGTPKLYNANGRKFKNSNVAGYLEWA